MAGVESFYKTLIDKVNEAWKDFYPGTELEFLKEPILSDDIDDKVKEYFEPAMIDPNNPKQRMLFLDDRTKRIESALKQYTGKYDLTIVTNVKECLRALCQKEFDIVSLDHDLNGDDFQDPDDKASGMEVVRYIVKCGGFPPSQIVVPEVWIHSSNLFAANLMISELLKVGIRAYFRRFEYDEQVKFGDSTKSHKPIYIEDEWKKFPLHTHTECKICKSISMVNNEYICHACYKRELIQCG